MNRQQNVSLANYSTMKVGGIAAYLVEAETNQDITENISWAKNNNLPFIVIGSGSNIVWRDEGFNGLVIVNNIKKFELFKEDDINYYLNIGAGENWDEVVKKSVDEGLTGIEALSLIPGKAGATPIQNVGAYGQELSQTLTTVEAYDSQENKFVIIPAIECGFSYRNSRFKSTDNHRFCITSMTIHLMKGDPSPPFYNSLQNYLTNHQITTYTPQIIRDAVIAIRTAKLPDPKVVKNVGSFFHNPIIDNQDFLYLSDNFPNIPHWAVGDSQTKLSAGWLIEQCGFKGVHDNETGMSTWDTQALVLINDNAKNTESVLKFRDKILKSVKEKFGITLIQEPELLP
ncbi:MAG TPA: UDP-N-acetylmuramate dehydrogenase [Patescibacteria group bacterium]|nr:UDP-N-acetylmuramate dehydrogenase [Patescibacteria group bacterium]